MLVYNEYTEQWEEDGGDSTSGTDSFDVSADQTFNNDPDYDAYDYQDTDTSGGATDPDYDAYDYQGGGGSTDENYDAYDYQNPATIAAMNAEPPATIWDSITGTLAKAGTKLYDSVKSRYTATGGGVDWGKMLKDGLIGAAALKAYNQASNPIKTGYQGGIPKYTAVREALPGPAAGTRPGAGGQRYFTDTTFANAAADQAGAGGLAAIKANTSTQTTALNAANQAQAAALQAQKPPQLTPAEQQAASDRFYGRAPAPVQEAEPVQAAQGGLMGLAKGGSPTKGRYLQGATDGMADDLPARIDGGQEAALSHGEFVIPADVVSHLGNGNSDAGAKHLYKMMDNIRKARTGSKKQGKQINPNKFTPGGLAGYAEGGAIMGFAEGGTAPSAAGIAGGLAGTESNLSNWVGPYVTDMLGKGQALSEQPYQAYQGPLTAGESALQTQAFGNAANLAVPSSIGDAAAGAVAAAEKYGALAPYKGTKISSGYKAPTEYKAATAANQYTGTGPYDGLQTTSDTFGSDDASQYMNPYLQQSLDPQLAEARRQAEITQMGNAAQMTKAGAYGGSRGAILQAEGQRNLGTNLANITGQGYNTAYTNAMSQYNADQARNMQAQAANVGQQQFGANQLLSNAQNTAQYGNLAQQSNINQQQFGANQAMTAAAAKAQASQAAQAANAQQEQFGAQYGLNALAGELGAYNSAGNLGVQQGNMGINALNAQLTAGNTQQAIEAQGVAADQAAFAAERDNPYKMVQYQQSLLAGLPLNAQSYNITSNPYSAAASAASGVNTLANAVK